MQADYDERRNHMILGHGVKSLGQSSPPPPCKGMPHFRLSSFLFNLLIFFPLAYTKARGHIKTH